MDINNTRFQMLMGEGDWKPVINSSPDLHWDEKRASMTLNPRLFRFKTRPLFGVSVAFQADLDSGVIAALRPEFEKRSIPLSETATVLVETPARKWIIRSDAARYVVRKEEGGLNIYLHPLGPADRRGAGVDQFGNWYWINDDETTLRFLPRDLQTAMDFWSVGDMVAGCEPETPAPGDFSSCPPLLPPPPLQLRGLAVTEHHYLVVGVLRPRSGLLIFDLHAGGPPLQVLWPEQIPFAPFDMTAAPGGGVWILDLYDPNAPRYWGLDRHFRVILADQQTMILESPIMPDFGPVIPAQGEKSERVFPLGIDLTLSSPVSVSSPVAIEGLPDGSVLILESDPNLDHSVVHRYFPCTFTGESNGTPTQSRLELLLFSVESSHQTDLNSGGALASGLRREFEDEKVSLSRDVVVAVNRVDAEWLIRDVDNDETYTVRNEHSSLNIYAPLKGHDFAYVPSERDLTKGTLYVADIAGNQTFAFELDATRRDLVLELRRDDYFPMRRFGGKALISDGETVYYDYKERWFPLVAHKRPKYDLKGVAAIPVFDCKTPDCVWHRVFLDAVIPLGATVQIESRAANDKDVLNQTPWQTEPIPYLRSGGAELPYYQPYLPQPTAPDRAGVWELLLQNAKGRYLELQLTLAGTGQNTPRIRALRVYHPRFSYLNEYLPSVYREDETSASFLDRFLANTEGLYTALEDRIAQAQYLLDVRTIPAEYLDWLAGWFGVMLDSSWKPHRRRLFIKYAPQLFSRRGTVKGLIQAIRLATDACPDESIFDDKMASQIDLSPVRIVETYLTRLAPGVVFGDPTDVEGPGVTTERIKWTPAQGAQILHSRYRNYLKQQYQKNIGALNDAWGETYQDFDQILMSPVEPSYSAEAVDWRRFLRSGLGFTYAPVVAGDEDKKAYQNFLARRYRLVDNLKRAYQIPDGPTAPESFSQIKLPDEKEMPAGGKRLFDWIQFVSAVLPIRRNAHRFTVLVPIDTQRPPAAQEAHLALVRRVVEQEKPAHTDFEVRGYWDFFRVGESRLGLDTTLGEGSRFVGMVIGRHYLAEGYLNPEHPMNVQERFVLDRDRLGKIPAI